MVDESNSAAAAERLRVAQADGVPCAPVRDLIAAGDVATAYSAQSENNAILIAQGWRSVGWKIGLTNPVVQRQLGVDQPDFGQLFVEMEHFDDLPIQTNQILQPRVEAEVAFVLAADLDDEGISAADVIRATAFVLPAIEIVGSRIAGWDITFVDTVADNASSGAYVLGASPHLLTDIDLRLIEMQMTGPGGVVSTGTGAGCLGHPVNAVAWLATTLHRLRTPLRAGDVVLSGALGPMVSVEPGAVYEANISGLGSVRARFDTSAR